MNLLTLSRLWLLVTLFSIRAFAQPLETADAGLDVATVNGPTFTTDLASFVADPTNFELGFRLVAHGVQSGQWGLLVSLLLTAAVALLRKHVPESTKVGAWLRSKLGGVVTTFTLALGGGFVTQFGAGLPLNLAMVLKAISIALGASGGWAIVKNLSEARAEAKAKAEGEAAVANPPATLDK